MALQAAGVPALLWTEDVQTGLLSNFVPFLGFAFIINFTKHDSTKQTPAPSWPTAPRTTMDLPPPWGSLSVPLQRPLLIAWSVPTSADLRCLSEGFNHWKGRWLNGLGPCHAAHFILVQPLLCEHATMLFFFFKFIGTLSFNEDSTERPGSSSVVLHVTTFYLHIWTFLSSPTNQSGKTMRDNIPM